MEQPKQVIYIPTDAGPEAVQRITELEKALYRASYALFQIKRFVDAGPSTRTFAADQCAEANKVLDRE